MSVSTINGMILSSQNGVMMFVAIYKDLKEVQIFSFPSPSSEKILAIDVNVRVYLMSSAEINWEALKEIYPTRQEGCFIKKPVTTGLSVCVQIRLSCNIRTLHSQYARPTGDAFFAVSVAVCCSPMVYGGATSLIFGALSDAAETQLYTQ